MSVGRGRAGVLKSLFLALLPVTGDVACLTLEDFGSILGTAV